MNKQIEAMLLALETLEWVIEQAGGPECEHEASVCFCKENYAINTLREVLAEQPLTFEQAWAEYESKGFRYGENALEKVRFGWNIASGITGSKT